MHCPLALWQPSAQSTTMGGRGRHGGESCSRGTSRSLCLQQQQQGRRALALQLVQLASEGRAQPASQSVGAGDQHLDLIVTPRGSLPRPMAHGPTLHPPPSRVRYSTLYARAAPAARTEGLARSWPAPPVADPSTVTAKAWEALA